jgi:transcription termination/antitermination protein NusA
VSDYQLSLAIGKEGQNARLAARLTGWRVDIKSETQLAEEEAGYGEEWAEGEWVEDENGDLVWKPAEGGEAMSAAEWTHAVEDAAEDAEGSVDADVEAAAETGGAPAAEAEQAVGAEASSEPEPGAGESEVAEVTEVTEEAEA